jgi:hypothetical protein
LCLFQTGQNPWTNGLRLLLLNAALAGFSGGSFMGVLFLVSWINHLRLARGGSASDELPFPYLVLMGLYTILFVFAWIWFGRRLPYSWRARIITAVVGAAPLFGLSVVGYVGVIGAVIFEGVHPGTIPVASFYVFGGISTLILLTGMTCVGLISLIRRNGISPGGKGAFPLVMPSVSGEGRT